MRFWLIPLAAGLVLAGIVGFNLLSFNQFAAIEPVALASCEPVSGIDGPEDIEIDSARRRAFISSLDRRDATARGAIHIFDLDDPLASDFWRDRTGGVPEAFQPLGLDYFEDGDTRRLFVVNEAGPSVEVFDVEENGDLTHVETFAERRLTSPNNIAAVGPRAFYVTNDVRPGRDARIAALYFLMRVGSGEVFYVDGAVWRVAAENLRFANGLALSPARDKLYVAETAGKAVKVFARNPETGALTREKTIRLKASPDNINVDPEGAIWVGALPKPLIMPKLKTDHTAQAPSEVIRVAPDGAAKTVWRDAGGLQSASTVAARLSNKLLIGALYEQKFLFCDLPQGAE